MGMCQYLQYRGRGGAGVMADLCMAFGIAGLLCEIRRFRRLSWGKEKVPGR